MKYFYKPIGTCSKYISFEIEDETIHNLSFQKGCAGNLTALSKLCEGKSIDELIEMFKGIKCPSKETSCPDQLAEALIGLKEQYPHY